MRYADASDQSCSGSVSRTTRRQRRDCEDTERMVVQTIALAQALTHATSRSRLFSAAAFATRRMPHDPLREWQERYSRSGTRLGFKPETDAPFYSSVESICNSPRIVRSTLSPGLLFRDRKMVRDGDDNVSLVVSLGRALSIRHRKREACLARNEAIIFQADAPGSAGTRQQLSVLEVSIAQREWEARNTRPGDMLMNVINRNSQTLSKIREPWPFDPSRAPNSTARLVSLPQRSNGGGRK
jgi:hypothetical protein